ncbi:hypothetical protein HK100_005144 [Physocladia obscura]|uniref:Uncharacterized protein n=1 Tax=Physocladia obscura TaxID=109957 RepID=A0AAD5XCI2_9FUNG|nr:hypothetical protein HK100_005144 [Physocladia obscura]
MTSEITEIAPGVFNVRTPFDIPPILGYLGVSEVGTHMTLIRLKSGKFVAFSTVELDAALKSQVDALTDGGALLEAVVATNAHHSLFLAAFHAAYPAAAYYGTPRHIRNFPQIKWAGDVSDTSVLALWDSEIALRNTDKGVVWDNPSVPEFNHFAGVLVYHRASKTLLADDSFILLRDPTPLAIANTSAEQPGDIVFQPQIFGDALTATPEAPQQFYDFLVDLLTEWDVENIATAHGGVRIGGSGANILKALDTIAKGPLGEIAKARNSVLVLREHK